MTASVRAPVEDHPQPCLLRLKLWRESPGAGGVARESPQAGGVARESPQARGVARESGGCG